MSKQNSTASNVLTRSAYAKMQDRQEIQSTSKPSQQQVEQVSDERKNILVPLTHSYIHKTEDLLPQTNKEGSVRSNSARSRSTTDSLRLKRLRLIHEAEMEKAKIEQKKIERTAEAKAQIEKQLVDQKLAADIAALNEEWDMRSEGSSKSSKRLRDQVQQTVEHWFEKNPADDVTTAPPPALAHDAQTDIQHLSRALHHIATTTSNVNSKLLSRLATARDLPAFSGDALEWLHFKKSFYESTNLCKYSDAENISRLNRSLRGEARETVSYLLIQNVSPDDVMKTLELRYGRPDTIIIKIVTQIRKMSCLPQSYHTEIVNFSIKIKNFVSAALAIQQYDYLHSPELLQTVLSKLPSALLTKWADYIYENGATSKAKLEILSDFLSTEAHKTVTAGVSYIHCQSENKKRHDEKKPFHHSSMMINDEEDQHDTPTCNFCKNHKHSLTNCQKFKRALRKDKWRFVKSNRLCHKCLISKHNKDNCPAALCDIEDCGLPHHRLLHWPAKTSPTHVTPPLPAVGEHNHPPDAENVTNTIAVPQRPTVMLKVVKVNIHGPQGTITTHALLDDGATVSLLSSDIAQNLGLKGESETLHIRGAWNSGELMCKSELINFELSTNYSDKVFKIRVRKIDELELPVQKLSKVNINKYKHLKTVIEYIPCVDVKPKLLIGQDFYHLIVPQKTLLGKNSEPCATLTPLGWCLHGIVSGTARNAACLTTDHSLLLINELHRTTEAAAENAMTLQSGDSTQLSTVRATLCDSSRSDKQLNELIKTSLAFEAIGVNKIPRQNKDDLQALSRVTATAQLNDNKWYVGLPWKNEDITMVDSYPNAYRRFISIEKKMKLDPTYAERYKERINHLFVNNYAQELTNEEIHTSYPRCWYLPHFGVDNPHKKKLRLVFDAAATTAGHSLNHYLLQGPDLLESLNGIMLRFREGPIAVSGDIRDMFLRVKIIESDQHALRFLWRDKPTEPIKKYVMTSLIFGANCSPFIAQYIRIKNAERFESTMPEAVNAIIKNHYIDDYIDSFDDPETAERIIKQVTQIHKSGNFEIVNWTSNKLRVCSDIPKETLSQTAIKFKFGCNNTMDSSERTLGLLWFPHSDTLGFDLSLSRIPATIMKCERKPTKRELLRITMSIYDIYGLLAPFMIKIKTLIQDTWKNNLSWDDQISEKQFVIFNTWLNELRLIQDIRIPRWYFKSNDTHTSTCILELHTFCDASDSAYAAVSYWRKRDKYNNTKVCFITCKSRIAPIKPVSIPRLELQAGVIGCRLAETVEREHRIKPHRRYFWTDSSTLLHWINNDSRNYKVFVANRLGEIDSLSKKDEWRYVPTRLNVADLATKRTDLKLYDNNNVWFSGPAFLLRDESQWPTNIIKPIENENLELVNAITIDNSYDNLPVPTPTRFSSWIRLLRSTANVLLFIRKCQKKVKRTITLNTTLMNSAERLLLEYAQRKSFSSQLESLRKNEPIKDPQLKKLTPYLDKDQLMKVGGRIDAAVDIDIQAKHPVILDGREHITRLLVNKYHQMCNHGHNELVVNELRQHYWIIKLRPTVRTLVSKCLFCRIKRSQPSVPRMGDLPAARVAHHQRPYTFCGVDLFGPMFVSIGRGRRQEKRYGVLFTCLTVRCIHIELVNSLATDSFIMALRRMAARRGWPSCMYSDNATNLRGSKTELDKAMTELDNEKIQQEMTNRGVEWHFISPASPHMGGAWERMIRTVKTSLKVVLKERAPKEETLLTFLAEIENMVNSRPLTHVPVDHRSAEALTPNHYLLGSSSNLPVPGVFNDVDLHLRKQWRVAQRLADLFWNRWIREVLPTLIPRHKWTTDVKPLAPGDLVVVVDPTSPRNTWPMGIIERVYPGNDGRVRVIDVKTKSGTLRRPATRVILLPTEDECYSNTEGQNVDDVTRVLPNN